MHIRYFDTLESTNQYCKLLDLNNVEEFTVIVARKQTAGIGQQGNVWVSEPYENLTFSLILKPSFVSMADQYQLTMMLAVAVAKTLEDLLPSAEVKIKWPNDIYLGNKKACGILTTCQIYDGHISNAICGIGLNINQTQFPAWVPNPTSLCFVSGDKFDVDKVLTMLLQKIEQEYRRLRGGMEREMENGENVKMEYLKRLYRINIPSKYIYKGKNITATITGVNRFGQLLLITDQSEELCCNMKEITFNLKS